MRAALPAVVAAALLALAAPAAAAPVEVPGPGGTLQHIDLELPRTALRPAERAALESSGVRGLQVTGPSSERIDLVFLGDGYTEAELPLLREHAASKWEAVRRTEPFTEYADAFNVWVVDVVSPQSGVDNDPRPPTMRDTALDMGFWCQGTERALCVDQAKADAAAAAAPEADQVVVLANSTKYGGVGGRVATSSGGSAAAGLITVHELGHSLGGLADEYDYYYRAGLDEDAAKDVTVPAPYLLYPAPVLGEPAGVNTTAASTPEALVAGRLKWWRWVGEPAPGDGVVGTYEGSGYYRYGQFRPTPDSLMHTLGIDEGGNPFNPPSSEQLVRRFYERVRPAVARTAPGVVRPGTLLELDLLQPATLDLDVRWTVDGVPVPGREHVAARGSRVEVEVADRTPLVRDPAIAETLVERFAWDVR